MSSDCNVKFKKAPDVKYCGKKNCEPHGTGLKDSCDSDDLLGGAGERACEIGYTFVSHINSKDVGGEDSICGWGTYFDDGQFKKCVKDPKSPYWNPLYPKLFNANGSLKDVVDKENIEKAFNCCSGESLTNTEECGDLYIDPNSSKKCTADYCDVIRKSYCTDEKFPERLKESKCKTYCNKYPVKCEQTLLKVCNDKVGKTSWDSICSCFYPPEHYTKLLKELSKEWNIPANSQDARPFCTYTKCQGAEIKRPPSSNAPCPDVNIATCLQNYSLTVGGNINKDAKINVKQDASCKNTFKKKTNVNNTTNKTDTKNTTNDVNKKDENKTTPDDENTNLNYIILFVIMVLLLSSSVAAAGTGIMML